MNQLTILHSLSFMRSSDVAKVARKCIYSSVLGPHLQEFKACKRVAGTLQAPLPYTCCVQQHPLRVSECKSCNSDVSLLT